MKVAAIDEGHFNGGAAQGFGCVETSETSAEDYDAMHFLFDATTRWTDWAMMVRAKSAVSSAYPLPDGRGSVSRLSGHALSSWGKIPDDYVKRRRKRLRHTSSRSATTSY
jgi:hypothetical protein